MPQYASHYDFLWLEKSPELGSKLDNLRQTLISSYYRRCQVDITTRCVHDEEHCTKLEQALHLLIPEEHYHCLKPIERYLLLASPWILNIAWCMSDKAGLSDRDLHNRTISWLQDKDKIIPLELEESAIYQNMVQYHDIANDINKCPEIMALNGERIRVRLITSYLRLADAIHSDEGGGPQSLFVFLDRSNSPEFFHWLKSKLRPFITSIVPEPNDNVIKVEIYDGIKSYNLEQAIKKTMELHVKSVKGTFVKHAIGTRHEVGHEIPCYFSIEINKSHQPILTPEQENELNMLMHEYDMLSSPNAGLLQTLYLSTMERIAKLKDTDENMLLQEINHLQETAKKVHSMRKCHIALGQCIHDLGTILDNNTIVDSKEKLKQIATWTKASQETYCKGLEKIKDHAISHFTRSGYNHFLLFGFSNTIITIFEHLRHDNGIHIFICEAHNKSRFDASGNQSYNDGQSYGDKIREVNTNAQITLIPDITISSIFSADKARGEKWVALFGANGVTKEAECGHSAGHLSLAIIANNFKVPVCLVCDSHKIGNLPTSTTTCAAETSKYLERQDQWLKDIPNWEQDHRIRLLNFRESIISPNLISNIITEDSVFTVKEFVKHYN